MQIDRMFVIIIVLGLTFLVSVDSIIAGEEDRKLSRETILSDTGTLKWLDRLECLEEADIQDLQKMRLSAKEYDRDRIDSAVRVFYILHSYDTDRHSSGKRNVLKLVFAALDSNEKEWNRRASALGDGWLLYLNEINEEKMEGVRFGMAKLLCHGLGVLHWTGKSREIAIAKLNEYLRSGQKYAVLGVLFGIKDSKVTEMADEIVPLIKSDDKEVQQLAANALSKVGNAESADRMRKLLDEFKREKGEQVQEMPSVRAVEAAIKKLEQRN